MAVRGQGRFHFARDASTIPQIFAQEATLAQKAYIIEETFTPGLTAPSPIMQGITALPSLHGYIGTSSKLTAQTVLVSDKGDPILAQWQYGLGRSVAWTSDAKGQWAQDWVAWPDFARFWGQAVRWTIVESEQGGLETQVTFDSDTGTFKLAVEALDTRGNYINNLDVAGSLVTPDLAQSDVTLTQTAPGLYEAEIRPNETGAYLLRLLGTDENGQLSAALTQGFVVNYSPEYVANDANSTLMADLAELGNGRVLDPSDTNDIFDHTLPPVSGAIPLWPQLLTAFVLLLPIDVGLRRIIIGREELARLLGRVTSYFSTESASTPAPMPTRSSASDLLSIKKKDTSTQSVSQQPDMATRRPEYSPCFI